MSVVTEADKSSATPSLSAANPLDQLRSLRHFSGSPGDFWPLYLQTVAHTTGSRRLLLLARKAGAWRIFQQWSAQSGSTDQENGRVLQLAENVASSAQGWSHMAPTTGSTAVGEGLAVRIQVHAAEAEEAIDITVLVVLWPESGQRRALQQLPFVWLAADIPAHYELTRSIQRNTDKSERLFDLLAFAIRFGNETRFMKAALLLCNELATRFACDRVALGWLSAGRVHVRAFSHIERFDPHMIAVQQLANAMEEAVDQDEDLSFPPASANQYVLRCHEFFVRNQGVEALASLPLRWNEQPVAVVTAERSATLFQETELWEFRLLLDACTATLYHLQVQDRWWGGRLADRTKSFVDHLFGVEQSLFKLVILLTSLTLILAAIIHWPYRIEAPFTLHSREIVHVSVPFDGYLAQVYVEMGESVAQSALLAELDTRELLLEASSISAEVSRFAREAEKAMSSNALAEMQIAAARRDQAIARLEIIRRNIARAEVRSPMAGIIVEGDLKEKLAAPVRKGDMLFKVGRLEHTYAELEISEMDVHEIVPEQRGEIAFVGRPDLRLPMRIMRLDPVAALRGGKNVFPARAEIQFPAGDWWRPGMGGIAKIDIGERAILWILTHRTLRFLQKVFWL
ncbi:MAG: efflux RND transporter periplasmic adaptor subunit [Magnetococcales bacterium]|nr:efflux RND transporter periplasmic adaptor subunit [Magnetococcales bacterium]